MTDKIYVLRRSMQSWKMRLSKFTYVHEISLKFQSIQYYDICLYWKSYFHLENLMFFFQKKNEILIIYKKIQKSQKFKIYWKNFVKKKSLTIFLRRVQFACIFQANFQQKLACIFQPNFLKKTRLENTRDFPNLIFYRIFFCYKIFSFSKKKFKLLRF